jgi:hypothetical protein
MTPIKCLFDHPRFNSTQSRWMTPIGDFYFDFGIKSIKGKENRVLDALSRSMNTTHLAKTSVEESHIKKSIRNLLQGNETFN